MPHRIALIGVGQLGSRHLQGFTRSRLPLRIDAVDPDSRALAVAEARYREMPPSGTEVRFLSEVPFGRAYDIAVFACVSPARLDIVRAFYARASAENMVLEKVLFPRLSDYDAFDTWRTRRQIRVWVNCPRRLIPAYQNLQGLGLFRRKIFFTATGGNWGLACNSIHMVDFVAWLTGCRSLVFNVDGIDPGPIPAKRPGFLEFTGILSAQFADGSRLSLLARSDCGEVPPVLQIASDQAWAVLDESSGKMTVRRVDEGEISETTDYRLLYQSELSHLFIDDILQTADCALTPYEESAALHRPLLRALSGFAWRHGLTDKEGECLIT